MLYSGVVEVNFTHMHQGYFTLTEGYTIIPVTGKEATRKDMSEWITWNRQELILQPNQNNASCCGRT